MNLTIPILKKKLKKQTFLNLKHIQLSNKDKLAEITEIINDTTYSFFRIIYIKNHYIVGETIISISCILPHNRFGINKNAKIKSERYINKLSQQMNLLKATGYYIIHNCNLDNHFISSQNIETTKFFYENMKGLIGHLIISSNHYYWLYIKNDKTIISKQKNIKKLYFSNTNLMKQNFYNRKISNISSLANYIYQKQVTSDKTLILLTNSQDIAELIIDIPNKYFSRNIDIIKTCLRHYDSTYKTFLITKDINVYEKYYLSIKQRILYKKVNGKIILML